MDVEANLDEYLEYVQRTTQYRPAWGYPDCPDCETDVFVYGHSGATEFGDGNEYVCHFCDVAVAAPDAEVELWADESQAPGD